MAGYVFAIGGDTEIIKICAERGGLCDPVEQFGFKTV